jgi:drug/metabolite transporter (DMT)-like permease
MRSVFSVACLSLLFTLLRKYQDVSRLASVGLGALLLAIVKFFFATPSSYSINTWIIMGVMGLFTAPFGRVLSMVATRYITAPEVSMTLMLETVLASIWGVIFFREIPPVESLVGGALTLVTIFLYTLSTMKDEQ